MVSFQFKDKREIYEELYSYARTKSRVVAGINIVAERVQYSKIDSRSNDHLLFTKWG